MNKWSGLGIVALMVLGAAAVKVVRSERPHEVYAATATYRLMPPPARLTSSTAAHEQQAVTVAPEVPGRVLEILVKEGERVQQGQLLMRLDASPIYAELAQLRAAAEQAQSAIDRNTADTEVARRRMSRFDQLASRRLIDGNTYEKADSQVALAREELGMSFAALDKANAGIVEAEKRLGKTKVRAPISGEVTGIFVEVGEAALSDATGNAPTRLLAIAATGHLDINVNVDNSDARREGARRALVVPVEAVRYDGSANRAAAKKASVFVVDAGQARLRTVEVGRADDRYVEIVRGLQEYDSVITGPSTTLRLLREEDPVTIVMPGSAKPS